MEIDELQKAWKKLSSGAAESDSLDENQIRDILKKRSKSLMERIDINIWIGFGLILLFIVATMSFDFTHRETIVKSSGTPSGIPGWLIILDALVNFSIIVLFAAFILHYFRIRRQCRNICDLRHTLLKITGVLTFYQRLFSLALAIIILTAATGFTVGFYTTVHENNTAEGFFVPVLISGFLFLVILSVVVFFFLRWVFRRIYGNYLLQLRKNLQELDEIA